LKVQFVSSSLTSGMAILIWKTENVPAGLQSLMMIKYLTLIENNPRHTTRDIAEILHIFHVSVIRHLKTLGYINRYDVWVPHNLTEKNLMDRISICDFLLKRNENDPFLKRIITGDENGLFTSMWNKKDLGKNDMSHH